MCKIGTRIRFLGQMDMPIIVWKLYIDIKEITWVIHQIRGTWLSLIADKYLTPDLFT